MTTAKLTSRRRAALSLPERLDLAATEALEPAIRSDAGRALGRLGNLADERPLLGLSGTILALGLTLRRPRLARAGARMISAHLLSRGLTRMAKDRIDRSRPMALLDERRYAMGWGRSKARALRSFPSGHTAGSFALARAVAREWPVGAPAGALAATIGGLQVLRRAHFPGDVVAGVIVGIAAEWLADRIYRTARRLGG